MAALAGRRWITQRVAVTIPVLLLVILITFGLAQLIPGDPARAIVGPDASEATIAQVRENLGLNQSVPSSWAATSGTSPTATSGAR